MAAAVAAMAAAGGVASGLGARAWGAAAELVELVQAMVKGVGRQDAAVSWVATQPLRPAVAMKAMTSWAKVLASSSGRGSLDGEAHEFWARPVHRFDVRMQPEQQDASFS